MTGSQTAKALYDAGDLTAALAAAKEEVRVNPADVQRRLFLAELLCFQGDIERADNQLDVILRQQPDAVLVLQFRQVLRAQKHREECRVQGRPPEFLADPPAHLRLLLRAQVLLRDGDAAGALAAVEEADESRPQVTGTVDSQPFTGWRDLDDLSASYLEVLAGNGNYYWVPFESVEQLEFRRPVAPRDLLWRRAALTVRNGPDGEVFVPVLYHGSAGATEPSLQLGRETAWQDDGGPVRGIGQRTFLLGEEDRSVLSIGTIEIASADAE